MASSKEQIQAQIQNKNTPAIKHTYERTMDLRAHPLIEVNRPVMINYMGTESMYFLGPEGKSLIEYDTGKQLPLDKFTNIPIGITHPPSGRIANARALMAQNASFAKASLHDAVDTKGIKAAELNEHEMKRLTDEVQEFTGNKNTKEITEALVKANDITTKTILGIDAETAYVTLDNKLKSKMTYSVGLSEVIETSLQLGERGAAMGAESLRLRRARATEYIDIDIFEDQMERLLDPNYSNEIYDDVSFGKRNTAYYIDSIRSLEIKSLEAKMQGYAPNSKAHQNAKSKLHLWRQEQPVLKRIMETADDFTSAEDMDILRKGAKSIESEYRNIMGQARQSMSKSQLLNDKGTYRLAREYTMGEVAGVNGEQNALQERNNTKTKLILSEEPRIGAGMQMSANKYSKKYVSFSAMEHNLFKYLKEVMHDTRYSGKLFNRNVTKSEGHSFRQISNKINQAEKQIKDVAHLSKLHLDSFLPDLYNIHTQSKGVIGGALNRLGMPQHVITNTLDNLSTKFNDSFLKGYNVEFLLGAVKDIKNYQEFHIGHADAIDLSSSILYLDNLQESMEINVANNNPKTLMSGRTAYLTKRAPVDLVDTSQRIVTELHKTQVADHLVKSHKDSYAKRLFRKGGLSSEYADLLGQRTQLDDKTYKHKLFGMYHKVASESIDKEISVLKNNAGTYSKFATQDSGILSKVISAQNAGRMAALTLASSLDRFLSTDNSTPHDSGQHAGMERSLQRLLGSDFGSPVNINTVGKFVFKQMKQWINRSKSAIKHDTTLRGSLKEDIEVMMTSPESAMPWRSYLNRSFKQGKGVVNDMQQHSLGNSLHGYKTISKQEQRYLQSMYQQTSIVDDLPVSNGYNIHREMQYLSQSNVSDLGIRKTIFPRSGKDYSAMDMREYLNKYPAGQRLDMGIKKPNVLADHVMSNGIGEHTVISRLMKRGHAQAKGAQMEQIAYNDKIHKRAQQEMIPFRINASDFKRNNTSPIRQRNLKPERIKNDASIGNANRVNVPRESTIIPNNKLKEINGLPLNTQSMGNLSVNRKPLPTFQSNKLSHKPAKLNKNQKLNTVVQVDGHVLRDSIPTNITSSSKPHVNVVQPVNMVKQQPYVKSVQNMQRRNSHYSGAGQEVSKLAINSI